MLIQILPNLFVSNFNINDDILYSNKIKNIVSINYDHNNSNFNEFKVNLNNNDRYLNNYNNKKIDYENIDKFICNSLKNNENIIILDNDKSISFLILTNFIKKNLNIPLFEILLILYKKLNINKDNIPKDLLFQLFEN